ncbi:MAG: hypothetical protein HRU41_07940 [Saprospiraceae bacterium]|nr:hypothetical protein [Saprospiraceae bacterium]
MKKPLFILSVGILLSVELLAQSHPKIFAYGLSGWSKYEPKAVTGYKKEVANRVYKRLIRATGDYSTAVPTFVMNDGQEVVAWMDPKTPVIGLEEKAYDICTSFGADSLNALAAILAHEIIHHYEKHDWNRHFAQQDELSEQVDIEEILPYETQADHLGGLLAFSAGFDTYRVNSEFLSKVYREYGFDDQLAGYPNLETRKAMVDNTVKELWQIKKIWETARLLSFIEEHELAATYYQYVLKTYQGYEIYNNAGVNAALAALQLFEAEEWTYILPLELDGNARLDRVKFRAPDDKVAKRQELLEQANRYFESAGLLQKNNPMVLVNQACILLLQGETEDAYDLAKKATRKSKQAEHGREKAYAEVVLGIAAAQLEEEEEAVEWLEKASKVHPELAGRNLQLLKGTSERSAPPKDAKGKERIEALDLQEFLMEAELDTTLEIGSDNQIIGLRAFEHSDLFLHFQQADEGTEYVVFHQTAVNYEQASARGIKVGAAQVDIEKAYGRPNTTLQLSNGQCLHYKLLKLLFFVDTQGQLTHWTTYEKELF